MKIFFRILVCLVPVLFLFIHTAPFAQTKTSPFELLKEQEIMHKDKKGAISLGKIMAVNYSQNAIEVDIIYYPLLLELTDVLKTPSRKKYYVILKGYTDSIGSPESNLRLSTKRAKFLKTLMVEKYYMKSERIKAKGFGNAQPVASNETLQGRRLNRRVEIHLYGDVSEAVRFTEKLEGIQ
jgi:outer membrane protein OmpA-like peptidoglycan-associated protein